VQCNELQVLTYKEIGWDREFHCACGGDVREGESLRKACTYVDR